MKEEHIRGKLQGIKIIKDYILTHLLFVDDFLILLNGGIGYFSIMKATFSLFQVATRMTINDSKYTMIAAQCTQHETHFALQRFRFTPLRLEEGLKYLGYKIKPLDYIISHWTWLIAKMEKRLKTWYFKYLSRAGRLTLIKNVLDATPVF